MRIAVASTLVLTVVLALAAVLIVLLVGRQLRNDLIAQNNATLAEIVADVEAGVDPVTMQLPVGADGTEFTITTSDGVWVNSTALTIEQIRELGVNPITEQLERLESTGDIIGQTDFVLDVAQFEFVDMDADAPDGSRYIVTAVTTAAFIDRSVGQVRSVLWVVIPVPAGIFALSVWLIIGRTLRPVDAITRMAERICTDTLHERLEEPGTKDEVDRLAQTLNTMLERLDHGAQQQRQFVSDASHELRSPLTVMIGESQLAAASGDANRLAAANSLVIEHGERRRRASVVCFAT